MEPKIALIDGDIVAYRIGFASNDVSERYALARVDEFLSEMLMDLDVEDFYGYLTGEGNYRVNIAVTAPYKGNRSESKPVHFTAIREYLVSDWSFTLSNGIEADDSIAIKATELGDESIICSIDKDFDQVPGWHYNFVKRNKYYVSPSDGLRSFYTQILTGDRTDNIIGIRGIGPVKADRLLAGCSSEQEYYSVCVDAYGGNAERVLENGRLLWLQRRSDELWTPPG